MKQKSFALVILYACSFGVLMSKYYLEHPLELVWGFLFMYAWLALAISYIAFDLLKIRGIPTVGEVVSFKRTPNSEILYGTVHSITRSGLTTWEIVMRVTHDGPVSAPPKSKNLVRITSDYIRLDPEDTTTSGILKRMAYFTVGFYIISIPLRNMISPRTLEVLYLFGLSVMPFVTRVSAPKVKSLAKFRSFNYIFLVEVIRVTTFGMEGDWRAEAIVVAIDNSAVVASDDLALIGDPLFLSQESFIC